jgi:hypothetical protein
MTIRSQEIWGAVIRLSTNLWKITIVDGGSAYITCVVFTYTLTGITDVTFGAYTEGDTVVTRGAIEIVNGTLWTFVCLAA